jgi:y4mF family transcriptional regulator
LCLKCTAKIYPLRYTLVKYYYFCTLTGTKIVTRWILHPFGYFVMLNPLATFVKQRRRLLHLSQPDLAAKAGVGLRFVRELEQGKPTLQLDKVNAVLRLFGHELAPAPIDRSLLIS